MKKDKKPNFKRGYPTRPQIYQPKGLIHVKHAKTSVLSMNEDTYPKIISASFHYLINRVYLYPYFSLINILIFIVNISIVANVMLKKSLGFLIEASKPQTIIPEQKLLVWEDPCSNYKKGMKKTKTGNQFVDSFIDNVFKDKVKPKVGSVVHCGLLANKIDHSGIYIGYNKIAHLDGSGKIETVTPEVFLNRLDGLNMAISIYVSCKDGKAIGSRIVAENAKRKIGKSVKYNLFNNNYYF